MPLPETIYNTLTDSDDDDRAVELSDAAFARAPRSFLLILLSSFLTKLGDALASTKTTIPWLVTATGAPPFVIGLLVPLRESGSMIPQLFIGSAVSKLAIRKWIWIAGSVGQSLCVLSLGVVALSVEGAVAGWAIVIAITFFSLFRALCSVVSKDVIGKTVPRSRRGQLTGWSASAAGLISVLVGLALMLPIGENIEAIVLAPILFGAGALWLLAAFFYARVPEDKGETGGGRSAAESLGKLRLLLVDRPFRRFVITRALLMCSALSAPFYVTMAQERAGSRALLLGAFVAAAGLASLVSGPLWGRFADRSSKRVMIAAALLTSAVGFTVVFLDRTVPALQASVWFLPGAYLLLSIAHSGVRVGRKTYVVNLGSGNLRTDYVAISNSVIGITLLFAGSLGFLVPSIGNEGVIVVLAAMGLVGAVFGTTLPEASA